MTLTTERLTLRPLAPRDEAAVTAFYMSERSAMTGGHLPRPAAWRAFAAMLGHWQARGYGLWAVTPHGDDVVLGMVGPYFPGGWPEPEIGWVLFDGAEGHGYAFEAARAALADAGARLGWTEIVHYIRPGNDRSIRLAERLGAKLDPQAAQPEGGSGEALVYRQPQVAP
ncbi:MAG: GNAT family N-acetyltransferase [Pseudomonadota bacterium]